MNRIIATLIFPLLAVALLSGGVAQAAPPNNDQGKPPQSNQHKDNPTSNQHKDNPTSKK
jgi:hypothetical protein